MNSAKNSNLVGNVIKVPKLSLFGIHSPRNLTQEKTD